MKNLRLLISGLIMTSFLSVTAQDSTSAPPMGEVTMNKHKSMGKPVWIIGIHGVVADDDGETFKDLFNVGKTWNFLPYPSRVTVERSLNRVWRLEAAVSYIKYEAGKTLNDHPLLGDQKFVAVDLNAKYDLNDLIGETSVFDPYTVSGLGYTHRSALLGAGKNTPTVNLGLGFNVWIYKGFGLCLQSTAKFKLNTKSSNYLMHTAGIVYRFNFVENGEPKNGSIRETR